VPSKPQGLKATGNKWFIGKIEVTYDSETIHYQILKKVRHLESQTS